MMPTPLAVVIDTSTLRPILTRQEPPNHPLCRLWQTRAISPMVNDEAIQELARILYEASPTAKPLQAQRFVTRALRHYLPWTAKRPIRTPVNAPVCPDPNDQMFIDLAITAGAHYLITDDNTVLAMSTAGNCQIIRTDEFLLNSRKLPEQS